MLALGSSKQWQDAMQVMTGGRNMSALPIIQYFTPLIDWLKEQNKEENIGWSAQCPSNIPSPDQTNNQARLSVSTETVCLIIVTLTNFLLMSM